MSVCSIKLLFSSSDAVQLIEYCTLYNLQEAYPFAFCHFQGRVDSCSTMRVRDGLFMNSKLMSNS